MVSLADANRYAFMDTSAVGDLAGRMGAREAREP
jgi:hypothetical protein